MTLTSFRVQLAVALGLPLAPACKPSSPEPPKAPPAIGVTSLPGSNGTCGPDQVHERLCGLVEADNTYARTGAPKPYDRCPANAIDLDDFDRNGIINGWLVHPKDHSLTGFRYDQAGSTAFEVNNGIRADEPRCCYERCATLPAIPAPRAQLPKGMHEYEDCWPKPESTNYPAPKAHDCPVALHVRLYYADGPADPLDDAPFVEAHDDSCCYSVASFHRCPPNTFEQADGTCEEPSPGGRPLREAEAVVVAPTRARDGWCAAMPTGAPIELTPAQRAHAASAWSREASYEHASVASFARLSIELMVHAAPAELVDATCAAARDEIRHAQLCYGLATMFSGVAVGPGPLALATSARVPTLEQLAVDCFRDGCVNETVAAMSAEEALRRSETTQATTVLATIVADEARHAELSYRILAWALARGDASLRARIAGELELVRAELGRQVEPMDGHAHHDERTGLLLPRTAASVRRRVLAEIVIPCTEALLATMAA